MPEYTIDVSFSKEYKIKAKNEAEAIERAVEEALDDISDNNAEIIEEEDDEEEDAARNVVDIDWPWEDFVLEEQHPLRTRENDATALAGCYVSFCRSYACIPPGVVPTLLVELLKRTTPVPDPWGVLRDINARQQGVSYDETFTLRDGTLVRCKIFKMFDGLNGNEDLEIRAGKGIPVIVRIDHEHVIIAPCEHESEDESTLLAMEELAFSTDATSFQDSGYKACPARKAPQWTSQQIKEGWHEIAAKHDDFMLCEPHVTETYAGICHNLRTNGNCPLLKMILAK